MPLDAYGLVRTLHVLAAGLTLGAFTLLPLLRPVLEGAGDSRWATAGLSVIGRAERYLLIPGSLALLVFGVAMVEAPVVGLWSFTDPGAGFLHIGSGLWMVLAGGLALMVWSRRELEVHAAAGTTGGKRVRTLWNRWTVGAVTGGLVVAGAIAVMAMKLGA